MIGTIEKMKAAVMYGPGDIRIDDVARPECLDGGFVLKVMVVGLCGSDIRNLTTDSRKGDYPHIYGHEIVGTVDEVSPALTKYKLGDRLYIYPVDHCLKCETCRSGHSESCENAGNYIDRQGGFAQYYAVTAEQISRDSIFFIPKNISYECASMGEPLSSVYACQENVGISLGDTVVIIGAGPIGCLHAQLAKLRGAETVIMIEINDKRLELVKQFGVDYTINSMKEDSIKRVKELTDGRGADKVISANPSTAAQAQSIFMAKKGGTVVFFGGVAKGALTELDTNVIHYNSLWIYGHFGANTMQVQKSFELTVSGRFPIEKFITHVLPLSEINRGIELTKSGEAIKVVLLPQE
jgi:L-iditol 2-dehydrogenase